MKRISLLLFLFLFNSAAFAQRKQITNEYLYWATLQTKLKLTKGQQLSVAVQTRRYLTTSRPNHSLFPIVNYSRPITGNWRAGAGALYFLLHLPQEPEANINFERPEIRPFLWASQLVGSGRGSWQHRYMAEFRWLHRTDGLSLGDGYRFVMRARYRLQYHWAINPQGQKVSKLLLGNEIMLNFGEHIIENTFDQNRLYVGLMYPFSKQLSGTVAAMHWFQELPGGVDYLDRKIATFALSYTFNTQN